MFWTFNMLGWLGQVFAFIVRQSLVLLLRNLLLYLFASGLARLMHCGFSGFLLNLPLEIPALNFLSDLACQSVGDAGGALVARLLHCLQRFKVFTSKDRLWALALSDYGRLLGLKLWILGEKVIFIEVTSLNLAAKRKRFLNVVRF